MFCFVPEYRSAVVCIRLYARYNHNTGSRNNLIYTPVVRKLRSISSAFLQFEPPHPSVYLSRWHFANGYAIVHLPAIAYQSEPGSLATQDGCALMARRSRGVWHARVSLCLDVCGVFVHCDWLEERAVDLLDHVAFSIQRLRVRMATQERNGYLVIRTNANPLGGCLDLDRPPYLKNDVHYLKGKRVVDSVRHLSFRIYDMFALPCT